MQGRTPKGVAGNDYRRRFGQINRMRPGRWQARYKVPHGYPSGRGGPARPGAPHLRSRHLWPGGRRRLAAWPRLSGSPPRAVVALPSPSTPRKTGSAPGREAVLRRSPSTPTWLRRFAREGTAHCRRPPSRGYLIWLRQVPAPHVRRDLPLEPPSPRPTRGAGTRTLSPREGERRCASATRSAQGDHEDRDRRGRRSRRSSNLFSHRRRRHPSASDPDKRTAVIEDARPRG